jgi:hypothetical protein
MINNDIILVEVKLTTLLIKLRYSDINEYLNLL